MKKAFTLIELLAVIIVLAIVALIATPIVLDVIEDARKSADKSSVYMVADAAKNYYAESYLDNSRKEMFDGQTNLFNMLEMNNKPKEGQVYINEQGQVALVVKLNKICYMKTFNTTIEEYEENAEECKLDVVLDSTAPVVTLEQTGLIEGNDGWYKESSPKVKVTVTDVGSGFLNYKWCNGKDCNPNNTEIDLTIERIIEDGIDTQLCVIAYDKAGNESELKCTDYLKIDTEAPSITGIEDIVVQVGGTVDLNTGVEVSDNVSGIDGSFEVTPNSIDTSEAKVVEVEYKVKDLAGNENIKTRKVIVSETPSVEYIVADGVVTEDGYANKDFYVTIKVTDNSNQGIKEIKVCTATTDRCEPNNGSVITDTTAVREITQEGDNRICVKATDNYGHTSETVCSDIYKLDKTLPTVSYSILGGTYNEYKTIRVTPNDTNYSYMNIHVYKDSVGVQDKFVNATTDLYRDVVLDSDGYWTIYVQVYDKAGNMQNQEPKNEYDWYYQTYIIDTEKPTLELDKYTYIEGFNGWSYGGGAYEQDGIVYLPDTYEAYAYAPYHFVNNEYWDVTFDAYTTQITQSASPNGSIYANVHYYDENFNNVVASNGHKGNGTATSIKLGDWNFVNSLLNSGISRNVKNIKFSVSTHGVYSTGPIQIKNFKIIGQLYQDFYNITVKTNDSKGIEIIKYALGEKDKSYFENNGTVVTTEEVKVTENGTYTFYAKDKSGNATIDTIVIDKIEKTAPIITGKNETNKIKLGESNDIKSYFNIEQNGVAAITQTTCINKTDGSVVTNTSSLTAGTHEIECSVLKANNKDAKSTIKISVMDYGIEISDSYSVLYAGINKGSTMNSTKNYSGNYNADNIFNGMAENVNYENLHNAQEHYGPEGTSYQNQLFTQDYIYGDLNYYPLKQNTELDRWVSIYLHGGWSTYTIQVGNLSLKFEDGNQYNLEQAVANRYIEPLVVISSYNDGQYIFEDFLNIKNGGMTAVSNYPNAGYIIFKLTDKSKMIGFNLYSTRDFGRTYADGYHVYQFEEGFEISTQPW